MVASLDGKVIAYLEARMLSEMGALITRHGGVPCAAPVLQEVYATDAPEVAALVDDLCADKLDVVVLQTGVGTRALFEAAANRGVEQELSAALGRTTVVARSPKPAAVLRKNKVRIDLMPPEPFTSEDLVVAIQDMDLKQKEVAVQAYGGPNNLLTRTLKERGANVREVSLYTWGLPEDQSPVLQLVDKLVAGEIAAVAFTSQPQVGNLVTIAAHAGSEEVLRQALNSESVVVASVGPVCTRRLREEKIKVDVEPEHPHMGNLVIALAEYFQTNEAERGVKPS